MKAKGFYDWLWTIIDPKTRFVIATQISKRRETIDARIIIAKGKEDGFIFFTCWEITSTPQNAKFYTVNALIHKRNEPIQYSLSWNFYHLR
jgi:hypothetical protein